MTIVTGTPLGTTVSQEELYIEGSPFLYIQDYRANPQLNPDSDGYYYGLTGSPTYPVKALGCIQDVSLADNLTINDVRCDTDGVRDTIQKRNYLEFKLTVNSIFPLSVFTNLVNTSPALVTGGTHTEKVGIGGIDNNQRYMAYAPKIYDEVLGHWLLFHLHKVKFVGAWIMAFKLGANWQLTGLMLRAYSDPTKPSAQRFGTIIRIDSAAI